MPASSVTITMDNLNAVTNRHFVSTIVKDAWLVDAPTYRLLYEKRKKLKGGTVISQPVRYARNDFQYYTAFEQFRTSQIETKTEARVDWRLGGSTVTIDDFTILRNGSDSIVDLAEQSLTEAKEDFINAEAYNLFDSHGTETSIALPTNLGGNIYIDSGAGARPEGLRQAIRGNTSAHTYANIGTAANTWWRSQVANGTGITDDQGAGGTARLLTVDMVRADLTATNKGASHAEYAVMDQDAFDKLDSLLFGQKQFVNTDEGDFGFEFINYRGCTFFPDPYLQESKEPTGQSTIFYFNTNIFFLCVHEDKDMLWSGWMRPHDQEVYTGQITCMENYIATNRMRLGRRNNLTP